MLQPSHPLNHPCISCYRGHDFRTPMNVGEHSRAHHVVPHPFHGRPMAHRFEGLVDRTCTFVSPCGPHETVGVWWLSLYIGYQTLRLVKKGHVSQKLLSTRPGARHNLRQLSVRTHPQKMNFRIPSQRCSGALGYI